MEKEFKTIDEQIELLQSRNLHIENKNIARRILLNNNYYYLINGYKDVFLNKNNKEEKFANGTTLEEIYSLYEFDRENIRIKFNNEYDETFYLDSSTPQKGKVQRGDLVKNLKNIEKLINKDNSQGISR